MKKLLLCVLIGIIVVGCSSKPKVTLNPVEELPYVLYEGKPYFKNGNKNTAILTINSISTRKINKNDKKFIELNTNYLSAQQLNSLEKKYNLLVFDVKTDFAEKEQKAKSYDDLYNKEFQNISFVRGEEQLETSNISMGDIYYLDDKTVAILLLKEISESKDVQIKLKTKDSIIYFNIER